MPQIERSITWTKGQRSVLLVVLLGLMAWVATLTWLWQQPIGNPPPSRPAREARLANAVDPNSADLLTLASLPGIGEARARAMLDYRQRHAQGFSTPAFTKPDDLLKVNGFGVAIVQQIQPHLVFADPRDALPMARPE